MSMWHFTDHGLYSVKTGYFIALQELRCNSGASATGGPSKYRNLIWGLRIPPKVRHFLWRACKDFLPIRVNLCRRRIGIEDCCPRSCEDKQESTLHVLVFLPICCDGVVSKPSCSQV